MKEKSIRPKFPTSVFCHSRDLMPQQRDSMYHPLDKIPANAQNFFKKIIPKP